MKFIRIRLICILNMAAKGWILHFSACSQPSLLYASHICICIPAEVPTKLNAIWIIYSTVLVNRCRKSGYFFITLRVAPFHSSQSHFLRGNRFGKGKKSVPPPWTSMVSPLLPHKAVEFIYILVLLSCKTGSQSLVLYIYATPAMACFIIPSTLEKI